MCTDIYASTNNENMSENGWTLLRYIEKCRAIVKDRCHLGRPCAVHAVNCTRCVFTHAQYDHFRTGRWSKNNGPLHTRSAKNYASIRFCRRSKFLNVCENFARNVHVGHVKHYCPFTQSSFCNISQTLRTFCKECCFFPSCEKGFGKRHSCEKSQKILKYLIYMFFKSLFMKISDLNQWKNLFIM